MIGRKRTIGVWLLAAAGVGVALVEAAGPETRPTVPRTGIAAAATEPDYARTQRVPEGLLDGPRRQVIILPREPGEAGEDFESPQEIAQRSGGVVAKMPSEPHRLPEGYVVGSRPGRIEREGQWFVARLEHRDGMPDAPPLRVLPNRGLAMVEVILAEIPQSQQFLLTGRITEFQGANYLLLEHVAQIVPQAETAEPVSSPTTSSPAETTAGEPSPADIVRQLMKNEPQRALVLPAPATQPKPEAPAAEGEDEAADRAWPEGTFLVDRQGRVVHGGDGGWTLAWEDRGEMARYGPIRLLPNRLLETALAISGAGTRSVVFIVSGEVMEYKGMNYLLLRKVLVRRDLGNFR